MAGPSLVRESLRPLPFVCSRCAVRTTKVSQKIARRWIGMKYLAKVADAELAWQDKARTVKFGNQKSMLSKLEERGLIKSLAGDRDEIDKVLTDYRVGAYVGFDPTAASLHVGHLLPLMPLFWMYLNGYHAVTLLGGSTSKIGDPTDRLTTRTREHSSVRTANMLSMHYQLKKLWVNTETVGAKYNFKRDWAWHRELVNNNAWWNKLPMLEILQILGPGMRMGSMLARETVKNKMSKGDGMSWAEFSYPLMQAWDWWHMYDTKGISMQIGGSDQYGNITAGIEAVKYISKTHHSPEVLEKVSRMPTPFGFTVPLLTTSSGAKFGKSAGNAVWLDSEMTSVFDLYGYFLRTADSDVGNHLKMLTFMPIEDIEALVTEHMENASLRKAQHVLAREVVSLVHGEHEAKHAEQQHRLLFGRASTTGSPVELSSEPDADSKANIVTLNNKPKANIKLPHTLIYTRSIGRILQAAGLADTAAEGHRLAIAQGAYVGGRPDGTKAPMNNAAVSWTTIKAWRAEETSKFIVDGNLLFFRKGKHNIRIVQVVSDEEYEQSGETYNGMNKGWKIPGKITPAPGVG